MKNGLTLFLGVFATLAISWATLLLAAHRQIGGLAQFKDPIEETLNPQPLSGLANQGRLVYQDEHGLLSPVPGMNPGSYTVTLTPAGARRCNSCA